ncbi:putative hydrolase or acyltransferase of alpha/beta superfamily [Cryptosporangium arvum DSM 44712]|uniref:Putative hydrolase or acyltransferase of alpha/beta superfamily n=2 Tax=Cryptosporangium TaxID=65502 RepID=A0A010YQ16_9ACTN|nr:putative hydrolase or acyltransferase of alpha/beta superfamily [Cryptosporangium arvum DSM 44712]
MVRDRPPRSNDDMAATDTGSGTGPLAPGTHEISTDGVRQVYHVAGRGPVCVAHPGGPGLHWAYLRSPDLEEHFTVVYPEPVGTGRSGRPPRYGVDVYRHFLAALIEHLDQPVHLLGHSHGGFVAQSYALASPQRLAGLVLYSTSPQAGPEFWAEGMSALAAHPQRHPDVPEAAGVPAAFQQALTATDEDSLNRAFAAALPVYFADFYSRKSEYAAFRATVLMAAEAAGASDPVPFDVSDRLGDIAVPTVVIVGEQDFLCGPRWGSLLVEGIPGAHLHLLPESGHFAHVEQPSLFTAAAVSLLQRHS